MEQSRILKDFTSKTSAESGVAKKLLQDHNWNLESALREYGVLQSATLPPVGPRKNMASNQVTGIGSGQVTESGVVLRQPSPTNTLEARKLKRGLSKSTDNVIIVNKARECVLNDIVETSEDEQYFVETPEYTFILPDLTKFLEDFRAFLQKDLIETATLVSLEQAGRLNWWADVGACSRLLPLATTGDGNCLLHAASLGMWGFHDRQLTLRQALFKTLSSDSIKSAFWRRWRWHQTQLNKQSGLILSEREWDADWQSLLKLASTVPRTHPGSQQSCCDSPSTKGLMERKERESAEEAEVFYESLEEFHVFVLAHVLRRPIIIVADTVLKNCSGEALAPIPFGGIYLPLESMPEKCHRSPLLLTYDAAHFSALVPMECDENEENGPQLTAGIPIVDPELNLLPVLFLTDPGSQFVWNKDELNSEKVNQLTPDSSSKLHYIQRYMDLIKVPIPRNADGEDCRPRSSSWSGPKGILNRSMSVESSESNHSSVNSNGNNTSSTNNILGSTTDVKNNGDNKVNGNGKTPVDGKEKKKEKEKVKGMHNVVKSFGSIGKTMSKKLKNLGGLKSLKPDGTKGVDKMVVGSSTQSTHISTPEILRDKDYILCSRLLHKRLDYQEKMVQNYLKSARESFEQDRELRQQQDDELRRISERRRLEKETPVPCINSGCTHQGTPAMSYLCKECYDKQRKEALDLESSERSEVDGGVKYINEGFDDRSGTFELQRQNTIVNLGSSKFYTYVDEDQCLTQPKYDDASNNVLYRQQNLNNHSIVNCEKVRKAPLELSRSSFYDESLSDPPRRKASSPGTARIINNLQEDDFLSGCLDRGDRQSGYYETSYQPPKTNVDSKHNIANFKSVDYQNRANVPSIYGPKVLNSALNQPAPAHKPADVNHVSVHAQKLNTQSTKIAGPFISRIEVGHSPSGENPPQKCRSVECTHNAIEDKEYYCAKCYLLYERNRTTFL